MIRWTTRFALPLVASLCLATTAQAQQATERYIPLGQSPGLSSRYTYMGQIVRIDAAARTVTVGNADTTRTIALTEHTKIWLDRSATRQTTLIGRLEDLQPGQRIEIKYEDYATKDRAAWIKAAVVR
ncbi:MAG: hypothetical protein OER21_10515 [Gemmatimonadota bacterium]|nr:hypothetical protein [Gemmatimonadota bacterium]